MAILKRCCCWKSVRDGSFACGIYTLIFYTFFVTFGTFHLTPSIENKVLFAMGLLALCVSGLCVLSSALLLVGLCADNRSFLLPWLICVSTSTVLDVFLCIYFMADNGSDPLHTIFFITDCLISAINVYCLLCVISQYQEYTAGRGRPEDCIRMKVLNQAQVEAEEAGPAEPRGAGPFLSVPGGHPVDASDSVDSCTSTRFIVDICRNESFSENTTSVQSADTQEVPLSV